MGSVSVRVFQILVAGLAALPAGDASFLDRTRSALLAELDRGEPGQRPKAMSKRLPTALPWPAWPGGSPGGTSAVPPRSSKLESHGGSC